MTVLLGISIRYGDRTQPVLIVRFGEVPVDPVQDVQRPVCSQQEHIVTGEVVNVFGPHEQRQLR